MPDCDVRSARPLLMLACAMIAAACGGDATGPATQPSTTALSVAQLGSLDSAARSLVDSNPNNPDLETLLDSTLLVLKAGVPVTRLDVATNLTSAPLQFVGLHQVYQGVGASAFSTWTLVGFDDPLRLTSLVEVSGFNIAGGSTAPSSVTGTIGDGSGDVNALLIQVVGGGAVTEWHAASGTVSFVSDSGATGTPCPGFTPTVTVTCTIETLHVHFTANAPSGTNGAPARQATLATDAALPTMKVTYKF